MFTSQKAKYKANEFGQCPRTLCEKQSALPVGLSDTVSNANQNPVKLYCPRCCELYDHVIAGANAVDGAYFGTTFPHLFLLTFRELRVRPPTAVYCPRVFGFKVHRPTPPEKDGDGEPAQLQEFPVRPPNEPVSDWDS